jgi:hypothetical protein
MGERIPIERLSDPKATTAQQIIRAMYWDAASIPLHAYASEIQRRQTMAIENLNRSTTFQSWVMIALTVAILLLTAIMAWPALTSWYYGWRG